MNGLFITGTDTDAGKTMVTAALACGARAMGRSPGILKPVQTGCEVTPNGLRAPDPEFIWSLIGRPDEETVNFCVPYKYERPCSPHLAARDADELITMEHIKERAYPLSQQHKPILVEGAGGLIVPLNDDACMIDLAAHLAYPVLLVARSGLGTLNHTLLSIQAIQQSQIPFAGYVLNDTLPDGDESLIENNIETLESWTGQACLGRLPYLNLNNKETLKQELTAFGERLWDQLQHD